MSTLLHALTMGGYFMYVWPAYGLAALVFAVHFIGIRWQRKQTRKKLQQWFRQSWL
ncbi:heme exporter protein CcmD [Legionella spiritensis]|uniref:Heme exporter protein D n=1 Tax=Legionella spiritensis TaxID=452 RepID=A0A0W0Z9A5_LEGSP|nr:heme exporter protein CcmD [Legionella spiritensis]KTD65502.1 heme exporter protein CcmD [Legionella spiritensis]SNV35979.1 cytochrome c-type biogenesis protein CcmD [Legionella spiritensis]VEG89890.1 cytochrome c-type biogenesis protein CcmD [Legionella spiritensis]